MPVYVLSFNLLTRKYELFSYNEITNPIRHDYYMLR